MACIPPFNTICIYLALAVVLVAIALRAGTASATSAEPGRPAPSTRVLVHGLLFVLLVTALMAPSSGLASGSGSGECE